MDDNVAWPVTGIGYAANITRAFGCFHAVRCRQDDWQSETVFQSRESDVTWKSRTEKEKR